MALVDVFYPDNPRLREEVVRLSSKLGTLLESNFRRTNDLIDCIHKYIPGRRFSTIQVNTKISIRENCEVIQRKLQEIQSFMEEKAEEIKRNVDPKVFAQLMEPDIKFKERVRIAKTLTLSAHLAVFTVECIVLVASVVSGFLLVGIVAVIGILLVFAFAMIVFGVLFLAVDAIISAFMGQYEGKQLQKAVKDLEDAVEKFQPESDKFNKDIERMIIRIEDACE